MADMDAVAEGHINPKKVSWRYFLAANIPSLLLGCLLVPMYGAEEYIKAYFFLFGVSWSYAITGHKKQKNRLMRFGIMILCLAPFLPIATVMILEPFFDSR